MQLETKNLGFKYNTGAWIFRNINVRFDEGTRTALLGESGIGKSTLAKLLSCYEKPTEGSVLLDGAPFTSAYRGYRPVQLIFQHPEKAVNPRFKMRDVLAEGDALDEALLDRLGIDRAWLERYPTELSGGELQRFCIARALGNNTRFIIADELSAMFDPITQAQLWDLLLTEASRRGLGIIAITHEKELAEKICTDFIQMEALYTPAAPHPLPQK
jgi:peptide/nickel transport system ATP-binding protein